MCGACLSSTTLVGIEEIKEIDLDIQSWTELIMRGFPGPLLARVSRTNLSSVALFFLCCAVTEEPASSKGVGLKKERSGDGDCTSRAEMIGPLEG